ncbi:MAG: hypothetical protein IKF19_04825 [Bacilli bacterium]|nr:hypothetical protein [Bacilli bacterium]
MKNEIFNFLGNVNIAFVSLIVVSFILSSLFLFEKKRSLYLKELYIILFVIVSWVCFYFFNDKLNSIFKLEYLNIKSYLLLLIIVNIITIINVNYVKSLLYKIINYMMFVSNVLIFILEVSLLLIGKSNIHYVSLKTLVTFMNINYIIFIVYINILGYLYLIILFVNKIKKHILVNKEKVVEVDSISSFDDEELIEVDNDSGAVNNGLNNNVKEDNNFIIDGVDCSVIFGDLDKREVLENYYILLNDVNAKLVNGYTVFEYTKIKDIINRLEIKDLNKIKLDINKLSMITYDEYNLLKSYLSSKNIKI